MVFERCFHKNLRLSLSDKRELLKASECVWLYDGRTKNLIGETYGTPVSYALRDVDEATEDIRRFKRLSTLYIYSVAILPRYRGRGLSKIFETVPGEGTSHIPGWGIETRLSVPLSREVVNRTRLKAEEAEPRLVEV